MEQDIVTDPELAVGEEEGELVEAVAVFERVGTLEPVRSVTPALVQAAAVAATGFVAGAATVAVLNRRRSGLPALSTRAAGGQRPVALERGETQTFLVRVHALGRRAN